MNRFKKCKNIRYLSKVTNDAQCYANTLNRTTTPIDSESLTIKKYEQIPGPRGLFQRTFEYFD